MSPFFPIIDAIKALQKGSFIIIVNDENRENEGDLILEAESVTTEKMAFIIRHTGGVVCMPLSNEIADQLKLPFMVEKNTSRHGTPFTISIEAAEGVTTGISAADRAHTALTAMHPKADPQYLCSPGHLFPLRADDRGVLHRPGHTEASIDLVRLAGFRAGALLSELMHDNGTMMRLPALQKFATTHQIPIISIADLITYRQQEASSRHKE